MFFFNIKLMYILNQVNSTTILTNSTTILTNNLLNLKFNMLDNIRKVLNSRYTLWNNHRDKVPIAAFKFALAVLALLAVVNVVNV